MNTSLPEIKKVLAEIEAEYASFEGEEASLWGQLDELNERRVEARATINYLSGLINRRGGRAKVATNGSVPRGRARPNPKYPLKGKWVQKVVFAIEELDRFVTHSDIKGVLLANEPDISTGTLTPTLSHMFKKNGELVRIQYSKTPQWTWYGLPRFVEKDQDGSLVFTGDHHGPTKEALETVDQSNRIIAFNGDWNQIRDRTLFAH